MASSADTSKGNQKKSSGNNKGDEAEEVDIDYLSGLI